MIEYVRYAGVAQLVEHLICNRKAPHARSSDFNLFTDLTPAGLHPIALNFGVLVSVTVSDISAPVRFLRGYKKGSGAGALGRVARGRVGQCGHLVAHDATEGRTPAKKRHSARCCPGTFLTALIWARNPPVQ
jgi:hypothetical protein